MVLTEMAPTDMESDPYMSHAIEACRKGTMRFKLGAAVIDKRGKVLSKASNSRKTHPKYGSGPYKCLHAEGYAIYKAIINGHELEGTSLYIYRENGNLAKPCKGCISLIRKFGIMNVYYSNNG